MSKFEKWYGKSDDDFGEETKKFTENMVKVEFDKEHTAIEKDILAEKKKIMAYEKSIANGNCVIRELIESEMRLEGLVDLLERVSKKKSEFFE